MQINSINNSLNFRGSFQYKNPEKAKEALSKCSPEQRKAVINSLLELETSIKNADADKEFILEVKDTSHNHKVWSDFSSDCKEVEEDSYKSIEVSCTDKNRLNEPFSTIYQPITLAFKEEQKTCRPDFAYRDVNKTTESDFIKTKTTYSTVASPEDIMARFKSFMEELKLCPKAKEAQSESIMDILG